MEIVLDAAKPFFVWYPSKIQQKFFRKTGEDFSMLFIKISIIFSAKK